MKKITRFFTAELAVLIGMFAAVFAAGICSYAQNKAELENSVFRLHIIANSNSKEDQELKIKVRDAILNGGCGIFDGCKSSEEAAERANEQLAYLHETAEKTIVENGFDYPVSCEVTDMDFDERIYGGITMPAGNYKALRITIGQAQGKNWWCVMYPPLCLPAVTNTDETLQNALDDGVINEDELDMLKNPDNYEVKFYFAELAKKLSDYFKNKNK